MAGPDSASRHSGPSSGEVGVHIAQVAAARGPHHILVLVPTIDRLHSNSLCSQMGLHILALVAAATEEAGAVVRNPAMAAAAGSLVAGWCFLVDRTFFSKVLL